MGGVAVEDVRKMIRVHLMPNLLHVHKERLPEVFAPPGETAARIYAENKLPQWGNSRIVAALNGRRLTAEEWSMALPPGSDLVLCPDPKGIDPITIVVLLVLSVAVNFAYAALVGVPEVPGVPQERGFDRSPTYAWDQIASEYRAGFPVPYLYGLHDTGGQVIYTNVQASPGGINIGPNELLRIVLALSDGRIEAVGGVTGDTLGEVNRLGGLNGQPNTPGAAIPSDIRVNGNRLDPTKTGTLNPVSGFWENLPDAQVWLRLGEIAQSPLPSNPFTGVSSTDVVGADLREAQSTWTHTISDTRDMSLVDVVLEFPSGLYQQDNQGNITRYPATGSLDFLVEYRPVGLGAWRNLGIASVTQPPILSAFAVNVGFGLLFNSQPVAGPIELRVTRLTASGGTQVVSAARWRQTNYSIDQTFAYPRTALIGLEVAATETTVGARPNFVVRCKGRKVRVFDAGVSSNPSTDRYWELPPVGDSYNGIWSYPPGRNPAWILADFLTARGGLGEWIVDAQLDWPAFRDWADFCDQDVSVSMVNEALCCFDGVIDEPRQAWDYILRICQAGRAIPVFRDGKISVVYQYSAAHGRGSNSVPAKVATQLVATSNVRDFTVTYRNTESRPAVVILQILNETKDYAQDPIDVADPLGGFDDVEESNPLPYVKQTVQLWGVTRPSQARREGLFMHAANREIRSEIAFTIGPEALASTVGDVLSVQHDIFRPYDVEAFSMRTTTGGTAVSSVSLNRDVTLAASTTYEIVYRDLNAVPGTSDAVKTVVVTALAGSYPAGTPINVTGTIDIAKGSPCALGVQAKIVKDYIITAITLEGEDQTRKVTAMDWVPTIHDIPSEDLPPESGGETAEIVDAGDDATPLIDDNSERLATNIALRKLPGTRGRYALTWEQPRGDFSRPARIYMRPNGSARWWSMGDTKTQLFELSLTAAQTYDFAISLADRAKGVYQLPDIAAQATLVADEFQPVTVPNVHGIREIETLLDGIHAVWPAVDSPHIEFYEGRWGNHWNGAPIAFRTRKPEIALLYPRNDGTDALPVLVRARHREGLYSTVAEQIEASADDVDVLLSIEPSAISETKVNVGETASGDFFGTTYSLQAGKVFGSVEWADSEQMTLGYDVEAMLLLSWTGWGEDQITVDEATFSVDSGEALWRTVDGREGTPAIPGVNFYEIVDDFLGVTIDDLPDDRLVNGYRGEPGRHINFKVWVKYADAAGSLGSSSWEEYEPRMRSFGQWAVKIELERHDADDVEVYLLGLLQQVVVVK